MNIVFFGTSTFAVPSLKVLAGSDHKILLVVTQPDRKKGRHLKLTPPVIKEIASSLDIPVFQPVNVSGRESIERLRVLNPDLFVVVSFGQILKRPVLDIPKKFCINLHASLLPKFRGAAPVNWALMKGEKTTGLSVFRLEEKMDSGDIILDREVQIEDEDNAMTLGERLSHIGADILIETVDLIGKGKAEFKKQDEAGVSLAPKLKKSDGVIDWNLSATELSNKVRGLFPWPGAVTSLKGKGLKILRAKEIREAGKTGLPGEIVEINPEEGILVKAKKGSLALQKLQLDGSRPMGFEEFLRGHKVKTGDILGKG
jgi:methionyl-tRNA formyltransferase